MKKYLTILTLAASMLHADAQSGNWQINDNGRMRPMTNAEALAFDAALIAEQQLAIQQQQLNELRALRILQQQAQEPCRIQGPLQWDPGY
jgi:hypothetical protein